MSICSIITHTFLKRYLPLLYGGILLGYSENLAAATGLWMGSEGTMPWSVAESWQGGFIPGAISSDSNPDIASFGETTGPTHITLPQSLNLQGLYFHSSSHHYQLGLPAPAQGGSLVFSPTGFIEVDASMRAAAVTIHAPIQLTLQSYAPSTNLTSFTNHSNLTRLSIAGDVHLVNHQLLLQGTGHSQLSGGLSGHLDGTLIKQDSGIWDLKGNNDLEAPIRVLEGTLLVNATTGSATGLSSVEVKNDAILGGTGLIQGAHGKSIKVEQNATLRVGNSHGQASGSVLPFDYQATASSLTLGTGQALDIQIQGRLQLDLFSNELGTTSTEADRLILHTSGQAVTNGQFEIGNASGTRYAFTTGEWQLIDFSGVQASGGTFLFDATPSLANDLLRIGHRWDTSSLQSTGVLRSIEDPLANRWIGNGATPSWIDLNNWSLGAVPLASTDAIFGAISTPGTAIVKVTHNTDARTRNLLFTGDRNYDLAISGGVFFYEGQLLHSVGGNQRISSQLRSLKNQVHVLTDAGTLHINQLMSNNAVTWTIDGAGDFTTTSISRRFDHVVNVVKRGSGTLTITSFNTLNGEGTYTGSGANMNGQFTLEEGTVRIQNELSLGHARSSFVSDQLRFNGGRLVSYGNAVTLSQNNRGITFAEKGASLGAEATRSLTVAAAITGVGGATISGAGDVSFSNANTYQGDTRVLQGRFWVNNHTGSATGSGSVHVSSGASVGGSGILAPSAGKEIRFDTGSFLVVGANHGTPSAQASTLTLGGSATAVDIFLNGHLRFDLTGAGSTATLGDSSYLNLFTNQADLLRLHTVGAIDFQGALLDIYATSTSGWAEGQTWKLIDWSTTSPSEVRNADFSLLNATLGEFRISSLVRHDGLYLQVVPEPSKMLMILMALGLAFWRRHRRSAL